MTLPTQEQTEWAKSVLINLTPGFEYDWQRVIATALAEREADGCWQEITKNTPTKKLLFLTNGQHKKPTLGYWGDFKQYNHPKFTHWFECPTLPPAKETE